jgi:Protein of unknown function (DUF3037)
MNQPKGYYSLIQFSPDPSRLEAVNIGVVVYSSNDGKLSLQMSRSNHRIRKFFGDQDWKFLKNAKEAVVNQLRREYFRSVEDLKAYIAKRANAIQLSAPRPMRISNIEQDVRGLYERLVGEDPVEHRHRITGKFTKKLADAGVENLVQKSVSVEIPDFKKSIRVPYAYQNGRFNLISPLQFDPDTDLLAKTGKNAIEGKLLYDQQHPKFGQMRLVVVANFDEGIERSTRDLVKSIFRDNNVTVYSLEELDPLVDDIKRSAAHHGSQVTH